MAELRDVGNLGLSGRAGVVPVGERAVLVLQRIGHRAQLVRGEGEGRARGAVRVLSEVQREVADVGRVSDGGAGLDVVDGGYGGGVVRRVPELGELVHRHVVGVHVAGEHAADTRPRVVPGHHVVVLDEVVGEDSRLLAEVRHDAVVLHGEDDVAVVLGVLCLLEDPGQQARRAELARVEHGVAVGVLGHAGDAAVGLVLVGAGVGGVVGVAAGVDADHRDLGAVRAVEVRDVGGGTGRGVVAGLGLRVVRAVDVELVRVVIAAFAVVGVAAELGGLDVAGRGGLAVGGDLLEVAAVDVVVDVVVAVDDADDAALGAVAGGLEQLGAHLVVADLLAVLGEVAGDEDGVRLVGAYVLERLVEDVGALAEELAVGVLRGVERVVLGEERVRHVVDVGENRDLHGVGVGRGGRGLLRRVGGLGVLGEGPGECGGAGSGERQAHEAATRDIRIELGHERPSFSFWGGRAPANRHRPAERPDGPSMDARVHKSETGLYEICNADVKVANLFRVSRNTNLTINQKKWEIGKQAGK